MSLTKTELISIVKIIKSADGAEEELDRMEAIFSANVLDPDSTNYIFSKEYEDWSAEEIVEKALALKPTLLQ